MGKEVFGGNSEAPSGTPANEAYELSLYFISCCCGRFLFVFSIGREGKHGSGGRESDKMAQMGLFVVIARRHAGHQACEVQNWVLPPVLSLESVCSVVFACMFVGLRDYP